MRLILYWMFFAVPALFCYLAGYTTIAAILGVYLIAQMIGTVLGCADIGVRERWYARRMSSPEYGGLQSKVARLLVTLVYEVACHFGLWVNDMPPAATGVARKR